MVSCGSGFSYAGDLEKAKIKFNSHQEALEELNEEPALYEGLVNLFTQHIWLLKKDINFKPDTARPQRVVRGPP